VPRPLAGWQSSSGNGRQARRRPITLGYFSADFFDHATAQLMVHFFERQDRSRFELIAFSFGPDRHDAMTERLASVFDQSIDVRSMSDAEVAQLAHRLGVDIAVDLKGYTQDSRPASSRTGSRPCR
jgi:protein O-GlcNAc transferase